MKFLIILLILWTSSVSADLRSTDKAVVSVDAISYASSGVPSTTTYLLGRNREWGAMFAPRWQLLAGRAARAKLAGKEYASGRKAWLAEKVGADGISPDGYIPFTLPSYYAYTATEAEISQAGAFYLSEACTTYLAINQYPLSETRLVATTAELASVKSDLINGFHWLKTKESVLHQVDAKAPNRLLFDALAFHSCGKVAGEISNASWFVDAALSQYSNGVFYEGGGFDTHYQAVAINQAVDLILAGYDNQTLRTAVTNAALWYLPKIDANGVIHSDGNTRTCWNGEEVLGVSKRMSPIEVWRALVYVGNITNNATLKSAAGRVASWINTNPVDTCVR